MYISEDCKNQTCFFEIGKVFPKCLDPAQISHVSVGKNPELAAVFYCENHRIKCQGNPKGFHHQFQPSEVPLIGVHGATHHGLAQAIGRGHEDHVFEAALRVQGEPQGELKCDYQHGCRVLFHTQSDDQTLLGILWFFQAAKKKMQPTNPNAVT